MAITPNEAAKFLENKWAKELAETESSCDNHLKTNYIRGRVCTVPVSCSIEIMPQLQEKYPDWNIERKEHQSQGYGSGLISRLYFTAKSDLHVANTHTHVSTDDEVTRYLNK